MCFVKRLLPWKALPVAAAFFFTLAASAQSYQYMLEPGSTITPSYYSSSVGPSEPLTGTLSWTYVSYDAYWTSVNFNLTALSLHSPSFSLTLNSSPYNGGTSTSGPWASFTTTVDSTGLQSTSPLQFVPWPANDGSFEGNPFAPSRLIFLNERLDALDNSGHGALISFTAVLVPEPGSLAVFAFSLGIVMLWRGHRRQA
jgi:hypothetical protein